MGLNEWKQKGDCGCGIADLYKLLMPDKYKQIMSHDHKQVMFRQKGQNDLVCEL